MVQPQSHRTLDAVCSSNRTTASSTMLSPSVQQAARRFEHAHQESISALVHRTASKVKIMLP